MVFKRVLTFVILLLLLMGKGASFSALAQCSKAELQQALAHTSEEVPEESKETKTMEMADEAYMIYPLAEISPLILSKSINILASPGIIEIYIGLLSPPPDAA